MEKNEYSFKLKTDDFEIELTSEDADFIKEQLETWRKQIIK